MHPNPLHSKKCFFVEYNGKFMSDYKTMKATLNFIKRKGYKNDEDNVLNVFDQDGNHYDPITGEPIEFSF